VSRGDEKNPVVDPGLNFGRGMGHGGRAKV